MAQTRMADQFNEEVRSKRTKLQATEPLKTHNRFANLTIEDDVAESNMDTSPIQENNNVAAAAAVAVAGNGKTQKPISLPPFVITNKVKYHEIRDNVARILDNNEWHMKYTPRDIRIYTKTAENYSKLEEALNSSKQLEYYTYGLRENKTKRIVFKGPPNLAVDEIKQDLIKQNIDVDEVVALKSRNGQSHSYLVTTSKETNIGDVKKIRAIEHSIVKWEPYHRKLNYTQCHRCQNFGHGSRYCKRKPRCLKCAKDHLTQECTLKKENGDKPTCANCKEEHTANYSKCSALLDYLAYKNKWNSNQQAAPRQQQQHQQQQRTFQSNFNNGRSYSQTTTAAAAAATTTGTAATPAKRHAYNQEFPELPPRQHMPPPPPPQQTENDAIDDFQTLMKEIEDLNNKFNIRQLIQQVRSFKEKLIRANGNILEVVAAFSSTNGK